MPSFTYSRKKEYWRPLCRNQLRGETSLPNAAALPCDVCVYPEEFPPVQGCWCNAVTRPQGVDSALTFTLGGSLGSDTASGTFLSNSGSVTYTNSSLPGIPDATMVPADGTKSSTYSATSIRDWITPSGTTFIAKNLRAYLPQLGADAGAPCVWWALAGMHYVERLYHSTIVESVSAQNYTYVENGITRNGIFHGCSVVAPHEEIKRTIVLDNNDPASVWLGITPVSDTLAYYAKIRSWVPQVATGMPADIGGPCRPVSCNNRCYPLSGHCWSNNALLIPSGGRVTKWFSYWTHRVTVNGYYWSITRHISNSSSPGGGVWLAWLVARDVRPWSVTTATRPRPSTVAFNNYYAYRDENNAVPPGQNGISGNWHYPASYHSSLPSFVAPGYWNSSIGGMVDAAATVFGSSSAFGLGMIGTARHPSWSGSVPSVSMFNAPRGGLQDSVLACYATEDLPCNFSGTASMQKIADYRTAPNSPPNTIYAGPSSFPSSATLTF